MVMLSKEASQAIGVASSSPFMQCLNWGLYDYDALVEQEGFVLGWRQRAIAAGSIEALSEADKKFYDICMKSRKLTEKLKVSNPLTPEDLQKIVDTLMGLDIIDYLIPDIPD